MATREEVYQAELAKQKICSICYRKYAEFGNNAEPVNVGTCCDDCNGSVVIPARISSMTTMKDFKLEYKD